MKEETDRLWQTMKNITDLKATYKKHLKDIDELKKPVLDKLKEIENIEYYNELEYNKYLSSCYEEYTNDLNKKYSNILKKLYDEEYKFLKEYMRNVLTDHQEILHSTLVTGLIGLRYEGCSFLRTDPFKFNLKIFDRQTGISSLIDNFIGRLMRYPIPEIKKITYIYQKESDRSLIDIRSFYIDSRLSLINYNKYKLKFNLDGNYFTINDPDILDNEKNHLVIADISVDNVTHVYYNMF